jgi:hypothetical protein
MEDELDVKTLNVGSRYLLLRRVSLNVHSICGVGFIRKPNTH